MCFPMSRTLVTRVRDRCGEMMESGIGEWEMVELEREGGRVFDPERNWQRLVGGGSHE